LLFFFAPAILAKTQRRDGGEEKAALLRPLQKTGPLTKATLNDQLCVSELFVALFSEPGTAPDQRRKTWIDPAFQVPTSERRLLPPELLLVASHFRQGKGSSGAGRIIRISQEKHWPTMIGQPPGIQRVQPIS